MKNIIFFAKLFEGEKGVIYFLVKLLSEFTLFVNVKGVNGLIDIVEDGLFNDPFKRFPEVVEIVLKRPSLPISAKSSGRVCNYFYFVFIAELIAV